MCVHVSVCVCVCVCVGVCTCVGVSALVGMYVQTCDSALLSFYLFHFYCCGHFTGFHRVLSFFIYIQ